MTHVPPRPAPELQRIGRLRSQTFALACQVMASVPAAAQALAVLSLLARQAGPMPAAALARDLGLPRSTTYHLLSTLLDAGFVMHFPEEQRYGLGISAYELANGYTRQEPLRRLAQMPLAALVDRVGMSAHFAVLHGREVIYLIEERAPGMPPLITDVGVRLPAQVTASGRAMLAALPAQQLRALFADSDSFVLRTGIGPRTLAALRRELSAVTLAGIATEIGAVSEGFSSLAAAVLDHAGHPVAAVSVTARSSDLNRGKHDAVSLAVQRTAREITRRIVPVSSSILQGK